MATTIVITPPGLAAITFGFYEKCTVDLSSADRAGSFQIEIKDFDSDLVDTFTFGSDVVITQDSHVFKGWVMTAEKSINGHVRIIRISGMDYTAKTQKILVNESYTSKTISYIVDNLFTNYATWATRTHIETCSTVITTIKFADKFLWDVMEQLCQISGYEFYIDESLDVHFFQASSRINANSLTANTYKKGSAKLKPDFAKVVNKLWVKGGKALSENFVQSINVAAIPIALLYTPRATTDGVIVNCSGVKTVGIQNIDTEGTKDFLLNFSEKLLVPDIAVGAGAGTITYRYEYPIKILLEDPVSQAQYGVFEDIYTVDTNDREIALSMGLAYLEKHSQPTIIGSIEPLLNVYNPGELVYVNIPNLNIDGYLQIKAVSYDSVNKIARVDRKLQIESPERDLSSVLKNMNNRLSKLEKDAANDSESPVERYISRTENVGWSESITEYNSIIDYCSDHLFTGGMKNE